MAVLYAAIPMKTSASRAGVFLALFVPAYYLTGASALVFAAVICLTKGLLHRRPMVAVALAALAGGAVLVLGGLVFGLEPRAAYAAGTPWDSGHGRDFAPLSGSLVVVLYAFVPGLVLTAFLGRLLAPLWTRKARPTKDAGRWTAHHRAWIGVRLFVVCLTAVLCLALSPSHVRNERMLHYHVLQRDWSRAIALGHRMRRKGTFTRSAVFDINRALAHEGRLGEELCAYPQDETRTLFLSFDDMAGRFQHAKLIELYLDLGCPNAAEKNAYELLDNEGPSPHVLEALVRIHLVKGQYESARVAFGALQRYAGGRESARQWREVVADPARARDHPLLHAWRRVQGTDDQAVGGIAFEPMLKSLLHDTPGHRLAFEYLMAHYLLKHQRAEFARWLPLLKPLGYDRLPRHYAEAVLVHALETRTPPNAQGWPIEPDVQSRFREISAIVRSARGNNQAVFDTLAPRFGDTYTFYSLFNVCGVK
jgi:hypothetical protein